MGKQAKPLKDRLIENSRLNPKTGCWEWQLHKDNSGYARIILPDHTRLLVHRASYEVFVGEIPNGLQVCHKCDNPICINPEHLFTGTPKENGEDKSRKGRVKKLLGAKNPQSKLDERKVKNIRFLAKIGVPQKRLAEVFGVNRHHISDIVTGRRWGWLK